MGSLFQRTYFNFSPGINQQMPPIVPDSDDGTLIAEVCENWTPQQDGLLKDWGYTGVLASPLAVEITGIFSYRTSGGTVETIICAGTKIYRVNGTGVTELFSGQTAGKRYQAITWDDGAGAVVLLLMNGTDKVVQYNGTSAAQVTFTDNTPAIWSDARPKGAAVFRNRIFYWGDPSKPYRIYTPRPGTYNNFDNTTSEVDAFDVDAGFGGAITGLRSLTDDLLVIYKETAIRRLSGNAPFGSTANEPFEIRMVTNDFGCLAPLSVVQVGLDHYFLSEDGMRRLRPIESYGDIDPGQPTWNIQPLINTLNFASKASIENACAGFDRNTREVWLSVPTGSGSTNTLTIVHNVLTGGLHVRPAGTLTPTYLTDVNRQIVHGDATGQIYRHSSSASGLNGTAMTATYETKWIAHLGVGTYKRYRDITLFADAENSGDIVVQWKILKRDGVVRNGGSNASVGQSVSIWDTATWDSAVWSTATEQTFKIQNPGRGHAIKLRLINTSSTQLPRVRQIEISGEAWGRKRG